MDLLVSEGFLFWGLVKSVVVGMLCGGEGGAFALLCGLAVGLTRWGAALSCRWFV